ncbi:MAG: class D sortase [Bacillota bacterium]|nr:class D sortase [Bacillota bacterium]
MEPTKPNPQDSSNKRRLFRRLTSILSIVLILGGVAIAAYPIVDDLRFQMAQDRLLREYEARYGQTTQPESVDVDANREYIARITENLQDILDGELSAEDPFRDFAPDPNETTVPEETTAPVPAITAPPEQLVVLGKMTVPKIDFVMPIVNSASEYALDNALGHIPGTATVGEIGNCGIAGHRGRRYATYFYRLGEIEPGDEIVVEYQGKTYEYVVYKSHIVGPEDSYVLAQSKSQKVLTIVTCDPPGTWTHRLIVHALQKEE